MGSPLDDQFRLVDGDWAQEISSALSERPALVRIVSPFIKRGAVKRILSGPRRKIEVVTRFDLNAFYSGVSDLGALRDLLVAGATVRGIRHLHSKMYLFADAKAIVTSANLTEAAMFKNHEFGFVSRCPNIVRQCHGYFENLWSFTSRNLTHGQIAEWEETVARARSSSSAASPNLPDLGETSPTNSPFASPFAHGAPLQSFIKFFGRSRERAALSVPIAQEVVLSGSHWACTYPTKLRPRQVRDGAVMFMARMVIDRNDYRIFGRAVGIAHRPDIDVATPADIAKRPWKSQWANYIRVHDPVFVAGPLSAAVSMAELMDDLGAQAFAPTSRNARNGTGNVDPRHSIMRKPGIELSPAGYEWVSSRLESALRKWGTLDLSGREFDHPSS